LVPELVRGQIVGWRRRRLAWHVRACPDCRALQETYATILASFRGVEPHPSSERLVVFALGCEPIDVEERRAIAVHLDGCASCSTDVQTIRAVDGGPAAEIGFLARAPRIRHVAPWLRPALAGAALAILLLGVPAYVALRASAGAGSSGTPGRAAVDPSEVVIVPLVVLRTPLRGTDSPIPHVRVVGSARAVVLALDVSTWLPDLDDRERVTIFLRDASRRSLWQQSQSAEQVRHAAMDAGVIALSVPGSVLETGRFRVVVEREQRPAEALFDTEFDVVRGAR